MARVRFLARLSRDGLAEILLRGRNVLVRNRHVAIALELGQVVYITTTNSVYDRDYVPSRKCISKVCGGTFGPHRHGDNLTVFLPYLGFHSTVKHATYQHYQFVISTAVV